MNGIPLSAYGLASTSPSPVNRMMASFAVDFRDEIDINLGVGYVNERTIPRQRITEALRAVVDEPRKYRLAFNYGGAEGSPNLVASLRRFLVEDHSGSLSPALLSGKRIIVGANGATSLLQAAAHVLGPGTVVTSDPMYYIYTNYLERLGFTIVAIPEDHDGIRTDLICERISARLGDISFFYVTSIGNPTSSILSNARKLDLVDIVTKCSRRVGRTMPLLIDGAYDGLVHDPSIQAPASGMIYDSLGIVYELGTLSKILAPALRIGYMIGPDGPFMDAIVQAVNDIGFSAPLINQEIASYMLDRHVARQLQRVNEGYREKAVATRAWIQRYLGEECEDIAGGSAGFYYYITFKSVETHDRSAFFRFLARTTGDAVVDGPAENRGPRVVYLPGAYCVHPRGLLAEKGKRQLRISYGYEELSRIEKGLAIMKDAIGYARQREQPCHEPCTFTARQAV
jgi:DNA-binding transcriptional MocR family regulator